MNKLADFLKGKTILEEVNSNINGKIIVERGLAFGTYISVGNLTQSGGIIQDIWKKSLKKAVSTKDVDKVLILGLGGGTVVKLLRKYWPNAKITGVDIDPVMVEMGEKYLGLDKSDVEVVIEDAYEYVRISSETKRKFDLVLVDLYVGDEFPEKFESEKFLRCLKKIIAEGKVAIFNRLYYGEKRGEAVRFLKKLEKIFNKVDVVFPEANVMFICSG